MKQLPLLLATLISTALFGQSPQCNCQQDMDYVVRYMEANFPGFRKNVTLDRKQEYREFKASLLAHAEQVTAKNECLKYLTYYVEYFQDNHTKMRTVRNQSVDASSPESVKQFFESEAYRKTENYPLTQDHILQSYPLQDIRGIYISSDSTYTVAILSSKTAFRDYIGVVVDSKSPFWKKNQVKFEIKAKADHVFEGFFYDRYHQAFYKTAVPFRDGFLGDFWIKAEQPNRTNHSLNLNQRFEYTVVDSTVVLRIPSFMEEHTRTIDSLYEAAKADLEKYPYLLIDVRNNGGGNSSNFNGLIPYLYTNPIVNDETVEWYATKGIIQLYEQTFKEIMKDSTQVNPETIHAFRTGIADLKKANPNTFVVQSEADTLRLSPQKMPQKVGILYNRGCASACEDLLFLAQQSNKTVLLGDHSGGFVGYGNVFTVYTPCYGFGLSCSTTRYGTQWKYEVVGIAPEMALSYDKDWIEQAITILKKSR